MRIAVAGGTGMVGRYVVLAAEAAGHQAVVLSRSRGVDIQTGRGLEAALDGAETVIDVTNRREDAASFFVQVATQIQTVGAQRGVKHVVTLSIVGIDRAPDNVYYAAKLRHEQAALAGPVPATVLRATQFHEFAAQVLQWNRQGDVATIPNQRVQTVAARTVGQVLVELAQKAPLGMAPDLAGPEPADLVDLARAFVRQRDARVQVVADESGPGLPGVSLPGPGARLEGPTFAAWLASEDAARLPV
jgi:uncharacterized protein YbjT (DUF2867 family)